MAITITKTLQDTVASNPHVETVYFDETGKYHFTVFDKDISDYSIEKKNGQNIPSQLRSRIEKNGSKKLVTAGMNPKNIVGEMSRKEILSAKVVLDEKSFLNTEKDKTK